ncbi:GNAT family N-acetyltransferase [Ancylobacter defluvii]|nr:GNAT family N-acetyltransferase [Ancylobacter defluvii]MBS7590111.1 GNAT family N-acetyltransferase [Ancylobacter defluvii]
MTELIDIRAIEPHDAPAISVLMRGLGFKHSVEEIARRLALASDRKMDPAFLAEQRDAPVGLLALHIAPLLFYPQPLARITTIVVTETARRRGVGRSLVEFARAVAKRAGCDTLELTSGLGRTEAHTFYEAVGFHRSGVRMACQIA